VNLFTIFIIKLISGLLLIGQYRSFPSASAILFMLVIQRKSSSSYERIKNAKVHRVMNESKTNQVTVLLSNQKARKLYAFML